MHKNFQDQTGVGLGDDVDFNQDWLIDEACVVREAEKLRLKQLQIEQEVRYFFLHVENFSSKNYPKLAMQTSDEKE